MRQVRRKKTSRIKWAILETHIDFVCNIKSLFLTVSVHLRPIYGVARATGGCLGRALLCFELRGRRRAPETPCGGI